MRIAADSNPRGGALKPMEMTVRRALKLHQAFEGLDDWTDLKLSTWREVFDTVNPRGRELPELWERYKAGTLASSILDLAENLNYDDMAETTREEIKSGLRKLRTQLDR